MKFFKVTYVIAVFVIIMALVALWAARGLFMERTDELDGMTGASVLYEPVVQEGVTDQAPSEAVGDDQQVCIQIITTARNPQTGETRDFPTPCDVPEGWEKVSN